MFERQRPLNDRERQPGPVVCWISRDLRAEDHWGLALAQQDALERKQPLLVVFCLQTAYLGALPRAFSFMLTGLSETKASLAEKNLPLMILEGPPQASRRAPRPSEQDEPRQQPQRGGCIEVQIGSERAGQHHFLQIVRG